MRGLAVVQPERARLYRTFSSKSGACDAAADLFEDEPGPFALGTMAPNPGLLVELGIGFGPPGTTPINASSTACATAVASAFGR